MKLAYIALLIILVTILLPGCTGDSSEDTEIPVATEFGRMLGFVPYSFLEEHDIWFGDPGAAKEMYGLESFNSLEALEQLLVEERREVMGKIGGIYIPQSTGNYYQLAPLIGWDAFMINHAVFNDTPPPWGFSVLEGDFDENLIGGKLTEQGYTQAEYGPYTYYWKNDDMQISIMSEISRQVLAQLNRVAVLDNTLVIAPATGIMTGVLDAMSGDVNTVIDNPACRAVADSLGDVFAAVLIKSERLVELSPTQTIPPFDLDAAAGWETLHDYEMVGMAYRDDGTERYWIISLYYDDKDEAKADAAKLVERLESYAFHSHIDHVENSPLTNAYEVGEALVKNYNDGATLTVDCRYLSEENLGRISLLLIVQMRDILFLVPDPAQYLVAADDIISGPDGWAYRANVHEQGADNPWPAVESTEVEIGGPDKPAQVTYRSMIETKAGQTRNIIFTVVLPEAAPFGPGIRSIVEGIDTPEGITVSQDPDRQWYDGDPVRRVAGLAHIHVSEDVGAGEYSFKFMVSIGEEEYGEVPCTVRVVD